MVIRIVARLLVLAAAIWLTAWLVPNVTVDGGFLTYLWIALLFALVNAFIGPVLRVIAFPLTVLTLGLFALVVNAALVGLTAKLSSDFDIDGFWTAVLAALLISVFSAVLNLLLPDRARRRPGRSGRPDRPGRPGRGDGYSARE
jgi:putative membrane protein